VRGNGVFKSCKEKVEIFIKEMFNVDTVMDFHGVIGSL